MSELHPVRIESSRENLERVDPAFLRSGLLSVRQKSWGLFDKLKSSLREGMTERDAFQLSMDVCKSEGVTKHWHKPFVRFGPGTRLTFRDSLQDSYKLQIGDAVYIDLGPVWSDLDSGLEYEGDIGDSFSFGFNADFEKCAETARSIFRKAEAAWLNDKISGEEIYRLVRSATNDAGYILNEAVDGHRVSDFPHQKYSRERLGKLQFDPAPLIWVLEIHIHHPELPFGAFYEDLLGAESERG